MAQAINGRPRVLWPWPLWPLLWRRPMRGSDVCRLIEYDHIEQSPKSRSLASTALYWLKSSRSKLFSSTTTKGRRRCADRKQSGIWRRSFGTGRAPLNWRRMRRVYSLDRLMDETPSIIRPKSTPIGAYAGAPVVPSYRKLLQPAFNNFCASRCASFIGQTVGSSSSSSSGGGGFVGGFLWDLADCHLT